VTPGRDRAVRRFCASFALSLVVPAGLPGQSNGRLTAKCVKTVAPAFFPRYAMAPKTPVNWMLSDAIDALARAERMQHQFFNLRSSVGEASWEPPIDVLETEKELLIFVALPGVDLDEVNVVIENGMLIVSGRRTLPAEVQNARIHRLELPQGHFERRVLLPTGRYAVSR